MYHSGIKGFTIRSILTEHIFIVVFAVLSSFFILRATFLSPGFIFIRDSNPLFYSTQDMLNSTFINTSDLVSYMDFSSFLVWLLLYWHLISYEMYDKLLYLFFPFLAGQLSFYYTFKYFAWKYQKDLISKMDKRYFIAFGVMVSLLYVINPASAYFSFWQFDSTFVAFSPALLAISHYVFSNTKLPTRSKYLGVLALSVTLVFATADPRSMVYSIFIIFVVFVFYFAKFKESRLPILYRFLAVVMLYIMFEARIVLILLIGIKTNFSTISSSIITQQSWALTYFFPWQNVLNNTALYWQWVEYNKLVYLSYIPILIIFFYVLRRKTASFVKFLLIIFLLIGIIVTNSFDSGRFLAYLLSNYISTLAFIFYPLYLVEILIPIGFLLSSLSLFFVLSFFFGQRKSINVEIIQGKKNRNILRKTLVIAIVTFVFASELAFDFPTYATGNYAGMYNPTSPPAQLFGAAVLLQNSTGYNAIVAPEIVYPPPSTTWNSSLSIIQSAYTIKNSLQLPFQTANNSLNLDKLIYLGVENLIVVNIYGNFKSVIEKAANVSSLTLIFQRGYIYVYRVNNFVNMYHSAGLYLDFNWPVSQTILNQLNSTYINLPFYGQNISKNFIAGIIGTNISNTDILSILGNSFSLNLHSLVGKSSSNPTSSGSYWGYSTSFYPVGAPGITTNNPSPQIIHLRANSGEYQVLICGLEWPGFGNFFVSNSTNKTSFSINFNQSVPQLEWTDVGLLKSNGSVYFSNLGAVYITSILLIPATDFNILESEIHNFSNKITIFSAEKSLTSYTLTSNYSVSMNSTDYSFPYLAIHNGAGRFSNVTFVTQPTSNTFGVSESNLVSADLEYPVYYENTIYYYVILGNQYHFVNIGELNNRVILILNLSTSLTGLIGIATASVYTSKKNR